MVRLSENDTIPRVENAAKRHIRLCTQTNGGDKYKNIIQPFLTDFETKITAHKKAVENSETALDTVGLSIDNLNDIIRDVQGRAKEYDRHHSGSHTATLIFPDGKITPIVSMSNDTEPAYAQSIAQIIISLGADHELYPLAAQIETAVTNCKTALTALKPATDAETAANTALMLSKIALVNKYNANYFLAATDVDKKYAEKLFPRLGSSKKKAATATATTTKTS